MTRVRVRRSPGLSARLAESTLSDTGVTVASSSWRIDFVHFSLIAQANNTREIVDCLYARNVCEPVHGTCAGGANTASREPIFHVQESPRGTRGCGQKAASKFSDAQKAFVVKYCNDGVPVAKILKRNGRHAMTVSVSMLKLCDVGHTPTDELALDCRVFIGEPREEVVAP